MPDEIIDPSIQEGPGPKAPSKTQDYLAASNYFTRKLATTPSFQSDIFTTHKSAPGKDTDKYFNQDFGFNPDRDNEEFYASKQGIVDKIGRGALKLPLLTVTKLGTGVGYLAGLATGWLSDDPYFTAAADNAMAKGFESMETGLKESKYLAGFNESADREKGFFMRAATDLDFWTDDFVDGAAFMAGAFVPGLALSKLGMGVKVINGLGKLGLLAEVGEGAAAAGRIGQAVEGIGAGTKLFKNAELYASGLDKFTTWATATASEAMFEGKGIKDSVYESLDGVVNPKTGSIYTDEEKKTVAAGAAKNGFLMNAALLGVTNLFELPLMYKIVGKTPGVAGGLVKSTDLLTDLAEKKAAGKLGKFLEKPFVGYAKEFGKGTLREGYIEENAQLAIQRYNEQYGASGRVGDFLDFDNLSGVLKQLKTQTVAATKGDDQEAAMSIGLGAILGGGQTAIASKFQGARDKVTTDQAIEYYNKTKENWLKAGNFYKTTTVETKDEAGNPVKKDKIVLDDQGQPVVDEQKLAGILSQARNNTAAINQADKLQNKFDANMMRDNAFAEFVIAHINAGQENTLLKKLDKLTTAQPEDLAKLGFAADEESAGQIEKYKRLASTIISQNKVINNNILFDQTPDDQARKHRMTELAAQQAVYRGLLNDQVTDYTAIKNQFVTSDMTDASDLIVDQLNDLTYRIAAQEESIRALMSKTGERTATVTTANKILDELKEQKEDLIKNNTLSIEGLKQYENGMYRYSKDARNDPAFNNPLFKTARRRGELENALKALGREWGMYADFKNGKKNFLDMFIKDQIVAPVNEKIEQENKQLEQEDKEEQEANAVEEALKDPSSVFTYKNGKYDIIQLGDQIIFHSMDNDSSKDLIFTTEEFKQFIADGKITIGDTVTETSPSSTEDELEAYLKKEYDAVVAANKSKGIAVPSYEVWKQAAGKFATERFNKLKGTQDKSDKTDGTQEGTEEGTEESTEEELDGVKDYDQDPDKQGKDTRSNNDKANEGYTEGLKQVAPAYSLANTTDIVKEDDVTPGLYLRDGVNPNYVFDIATKEFMPGAQVTYKVMTKDFEPYVNRLTGEVFDGSVVFDENGKVKPEMFDYAPIGIYSVIRGEERLIGTVHEPQWIEYKIGNNYRHIVIPGEQAGESVPQVVTMEVNKLRALRQHMLENFNKNSNFVLQGTVASKSLGILRTMEKAGLLKDRVNPKIGEGGTDNTHGMFAIIRNGSIQTEKNGAIENLEATESFSLDNVNKYQGVPVLLLPTPRGTFFPTFVQLPNLSVEHSQFILDAWKAFTGQEENAELINEVYKATRRSMGDGGPDVLVLKDYIEQYYTTLNDEKLSRLGNGSELPNGVARLNITKDGKMYLQVKDKDGNWFSNVNNPFTKASELPDNILSLMGNLLTNISFPKTELYKLGINSTEKTTFLTVVNGKLKKQVATYNEYMMGRVMTTVEKGVPSKTENGDWVYFANPVIQITPAALSVTPIDTFTETTTPVEPGTTLESDIETDDLFAQLERLALANEMNEDQIKDESGKCNPFKDA